VMTGGAVRLRAARFRASTIAIASVGIWLGGASSIAPATTGAPPAGPPTATPGPPSATPPPTTPTPAPAPLVWTAIAAGADRATATSADGSTEVLLFRFDLRRFRARVVVGAGRPAHPATAAEARRERGAVAVVNGGFFDEHRAPLGLRLADGETRAALRTRADWGVLMLSSEKARIVHTRDFTAASAATTPPITDAIQVGPRIVVDGLPTRLKPQLARRTAVALDRDGKTLTLVLVSDGIEANDLGARLAAAGFDTALMLDGGPSTQLSLDVGNTRLEIPGGYGVPDLLAIVPVPASAPASVPASAMAPTPKRGAAPPTTPTRVKTPARP
jgi:uncharacterized protein YigE (DUF2233 family)